MNLENIKWLNQNLVHYKDETYNTNSTLDIFISSTTEDFKNFNPTNINFSIISFEMRKTYSFSYYQAYDLLKSISSMFESIKKNSEKEEVVKSNSKKSFRIVYSTETNDGYPVISISINYSNTDKAYIILPILVFHSFLSIIKSYVTDYLKFNTDFINRILLAEIFDEIKSTNLSIRNLPSHLIVSDTSIISGKNKISDYSEVDEESENLNNFLIDDISSEEGKKINNDFNDFLENNLDKIKLDIPNTTSKENKEKVNSILYEQILKGDVQNFINLLNSISLERSPHNKIKDEFKDIKIEDFLPDISNEDLKSFYYISNIIYKSSFKKYVSGIDVIPSTFPILRYKIEDKEKIKIENKELAYDLLILSFYIRSMKTKMESREDHPMSNYSIANMATRLYFDILIYPFIEYDDLNVIKSSITKRFESYKKSGFFNYFTEELNNYNLPDVDINDILKNVDFVFSNLNNEKLPYIEKIHDALYSNGSLRIPYKNSFNSFEELELIFEIESSEKANVNVKDIDEIYKIVEEEKVPDYIISLFSKDFKKPDEKKKKRSEHNSDTNILKYVKFNDTDIPEVIREPFISYIESLKTENYDFKNSGFIIDNIPENIIKGLYIWNESTNKNEKYVDYVKKIEECIMKKDDIIIMVESKYEDNVKEDSTDWNDLDF